MATVNQIRARLAAKIGELHVDRDAGPTRASTSVRYISSIIDIWSLRFQLAQLQLLNAADDDEQQRFAAEASDASKHIAEHEKRLVVARKAKSDDDDDDASDHEAEQEGLAGTLRLLAGK